MTTLQEVLRGGRQCDEDGAEIIMSREACVKAADALDAKDRVLREISEEWAGAECGEPVTAQEAYAIALAERMYRLAVEGLK